MIFQEIRTSIAKKPYIFVVFFRGGGGGDRTLWIRIRTNFPITGPGEWLSVLAFHQ